MVTSPVLREFTCVGKRRKKAPRRQWRSVARSSPEVASAAKRLGERLEALRRNRGLSQEDVASGALIDAKHYQEVEAGKTNPTLATLVGIAKALELTLSGLFKGV